MKPDDVLKLSNGEVLSPELINLRTFKPIPNGLLCEKIFGPVKNYECNCGRHKGKEYKGKICKICGVEITTSLVRTRRMGHITLPEPVVHPLAIKHLATLLGITVKTIRRILDGEYFVGYTEDLDGPLILRTKKQLLQVRIITLDTSKKFRRGPKGLYDIVKNITLQKTYNITPKGYKKRIFKKLMDEKYHPKDYFLKYLPVSPAAYRPVLDMGAGVMISNAINELYIRVLHKKNRIERFKEHCRIKLIEDEELVQLQKAVDELLIKGARGRDGQYIPGKIHTICKKQGLIRNNLLGKRVDFSGRSVITTGPHLKLDEVGIPFEMAYNLFTPFIIAELIQNKVVENYTEAMYLLGLKKKRKKRRKDLPEKVLKAFDTVVKRHRILLNRQPTLHKFNMQSFKIKITNDRAIKISPMACAPANSDFDGDSFYGNVLIKLKKQQKNGDKTTKFIECNIADLESLEQ